MQCVAIGPFIVPNLTFPISTTREFDYSTLLQCGYQQLDVQQIPHAVWGGVHDGKPVFGINSDQQGFKRITSTQQVYMPFPNDVKAAAPLVINDSGTELVGAGPKLRILCYDASSGERVQNLSDNPEGLDGMVGTLAVRSEIHR